MNKKEFKLLSRISISSFPMGCFLITLISLIIVLSHILPIDLANGYGDSTGRMILIEQTLENGVHWLTSTIWLPFYFWLYRVPLLIYDHFHSLYVFQVSLLLVLVLFIFKLIFKDRTFIANLAGCVAIAICPTSLHLANSVLSELSFALFIVLGIYFAEKSQSQNNNKNLFWACLLLLLASQTRYEGWLIYPAFSAYVFYITRSWKVFLISFLPFVTGVFLTEYFLSTVKEGLFSGMTSNPDESGPINVKLGLISIIDKTQRISKILWINLGLVLCLLPMAIFKGIKSRCLFTINFLYIFSIVFFGCLLDKVAIFHRYWYLPTVLAWIVFLKNMNLKSKIIKSAVLASLFFMFYQSLNGWQPSHMHPTNETYQFLKLDNAKSVYVDEIGGSYYFYAYKVLNQFDDSEMKILHYNDHLSLITDPKKFEEALKLDFKGQLIRREFNYIVLIKNSILMNIIKKNKLMDLESDWELLFEKKNILIYKLRSNWEEVI